MLSLREPTVSHHLRSLRELGIVTARADGTSRIHALDTDALEKLSADVLSRERLAAGAGAADPLAWDRKVLATFLDGGRLATCSGNIVRNIVNEGPYPAEVQGFGIGIAVEADTAVTGNVIENVARIGLHMGWGRYLRDVNASANVIRDCPTGIAVTVVEEAGPALVANNIISGAGAGAIVGYRWTEAVTGDLTAPGTDIPAHLRLSGNLVS